MLAGKVVAIVVAFNAATQKTEVVPTLVDSGTPAQCEQAIANNNLSLVSEVLRARGYDKDPWSIKITCIDNP